MAKLLINPLTEKRLKSFLANPSHALLLNGQEGSALKDISEYLRKTFTEDRPDAEALVLVESNDKGTIPIETIRGLSRRLKLHNAAEGISVITVIDSAEAMQAEAQNSLLKLLEEPPHGVLFILLTHDDSKILSTISSRCVPIDVLPVSLSQAQIYFNSRTDEFARLYRLSGGQAGLLKELLDNKEHPLANAIEDAKRLLASTPFNRIKYVDSQYKKKDAATLLVKAVLRVCTAGLQSGRTSSRWIHNCRAAKDALMMLDANVQTKIVLDKLFLNMR